LNRIVSPESDRRSHRPHQQHDQQDQHQRGLNQGRTSIIPSDFVGRPIDDTMIGYCR